jgi:hypothetical protein
MVVTIVTWASYRQAAGQEQENGCFKAASY